VVSAQSAIVLRAHLADLTIWGYGGNAIGISWGVSENSSVLDPS